jgi:hypothetical protein
VMGTLSEQGGQRFCRKAIAFLAPRSNAFKCYSEGEESTLKEVRSLRPRVIDIWGWTITQPALVTSGSRGETVYKKCALSSVRKAGVGAD